MDVKKTTMLPTQFQHAFFRKLGYAVWATMLLLSLVFYKERAFFMDAGFQLFNLINEEAIQIYHYRFVTALPQVLPYFLLKLGAPLWALAMSFSASYILFYLLVYHLLVKYLNNDRLGWVLVFLFTLISFDTFYHIQSEFYLGLSLLLLTFGIALRYPELRGWRAWAAMLPLMVSVGFSHKLSLIFFLFLWLFFGWSHKKLRHRRYLVFLAVFVVIAVFKSVFFTNWYEAAKQVDFRNNWATFFPDFHTIPANFIFLKYCLLYYYMLPALLLAVSVFYFMKKEWLKPALMWAFSIGFLMLYNISDPQAPYRFYSEVTYLPLSIFVAVPFLFDMVQGSAAKKWGGLTGVFLTGLMLLRLATIAWNHRTFDRLFTWVETTVENSGQLGTNRFLLKKENAPMDTVIMEWGVPFTAMHLSALESPQSAKTLLILPDFEKYKDILGEDHYFLSPFKAIEIGELNEKYYDPGRGRYVEIGGD